MDLIARLPHIYDVATSQSNWERVESNLLEGLEIRQIADIKNKSPDTIKNQCRSIYSKIGISNRVQLIRKTIILSPPIS